MLHSWVVMNSKLQTSTPRPVFSGTLPGFSTLMPSEKNVFFFFFLKILSMIRTSDWKPKLFLENCMRWQDSPGNASTMPGAANLQFPQVKMSTRWDPSQVCLSLCPSSSTFTLPWPFLHLMGKSGVNLLPLHWTIYWLTLFLVLTTNE